jgi:hypothetical protein
VLINVANDIVGIDDVRYTPNGPAVVPEPTTLAIGGLGGLGFVIFALRRRK